MSTIENFIKQFSSAVYKYQIRQNAPEALWEKSSEYALIYAISKCGFLDVDDYLKNNPDVAKDGIDPVTHFVKYGLGEKRKFKLGENFGDISIKSEKTEVEENFNQSIENTTSKMPTSDKQFEQKTVKQEILVDKKYLETLECQNKILHDQIRIFRNEMIRKCNLIHDLEYRLRVKKK